LKKLIIPSLPVPDALRRLRTGCTLALAALCVMLMAQNQAMAAARAAVFDVELIDTSTEGAYYGKREDQTKRLALLGETLRQKLREKGLYEIVDVAPAAEAIAKSQALTDCGHCAVDIAKSLDADVAIVTYVQKVSNLILNINIQILDVKTGQTLLLTSADIRGNTEESWLRGLSWLIEHRLSK
jgi:hypothetical protein